MSPHRESDDYGTAFRPCHSETPSELVTERELPDPHESRLDVHATETRQIRLIDSRIIAELRRVRQVEDLEADLPALAARKVRRFRQHKIDVLAELPPRVASGPRRVA